MGFGALNQERVLADKANADQRTESGKRKEVERPLKETCLEHTNAFTPSVLEQWHRRENLLPGLALLVLTVVGWVYIAYQASIMGSMETMSGARISTMGGFVPFVLGWTAMMVAMMIPATLPLILLYRLVARQRLNPMQARIGMAALLSGYIVVWASAGLPVYLYALAAQSIGRFAAVLPAGLLVIGGVYQFTSLKRSCHARCSNPLFFLMQKWKPGTAGALRLGVLHGIDCLGCCAGLMVGLIALGMMNLALVFTAALIIFAEKTLPNSHRIAPPLGFLMIAGGVAFFGFSLLSGMQAQMEPAVEEPGMPAIEDSTENMEEPGMESM
jgi:predicted metal-binding membrane protein